MMFFFILPFAATAFYFVVNIAAQAIWAAFEVVV